MRETRICCGGFDNVDFSKRRPVGSNMLGLIDALVHMRKQVGVLLYTVRLWNAETGRTVGGALTGHAAGANSVAFSPDGRRIVTGSFDKTVRLWDAMTGRPIGRAMTGHADLVASVAFSPDGRQIVSGSWDGTARLWPSPASWSDAVRAKLSQNLSHGQWRE